MSVRHLVNIIGLLLVFVSIAMAATFSPILML